MRVSDDQVATLQAYLSGDFDRYEQLSQQLDRDSAWNGYMALLEAAFFTAVDRRFGARYENADVIAFVGEVRGRSEGLGRGIDPRTAERLVNAVLGIGEVNDVDNKTRFGTEIVLLAALVADEGPDVASLDDLVAKAKALAEG